MSIGPIGFLGASRPFEGIEPMTPRPAAGEMRKSGDTFELGGNHHVSFFADAAGGAPPLADSRGDAGSAVTVSRAS